MDLLTVVIFVCLVLAAIGGYVVIGFFRYKSYFTRVRQLLVMTGARIWTMCAPTQALTSMLTVCALLTMVACSGSDNGWKGGLVMTVHSSRYKDASKVCHKIEAEAVGKDPASFQSDPIPHGCRQVKDKDCYVYTGDDTPEGMFGELVQDCFETRAADIDGETKP